MNLYSFRIKITCFLLLGVVAYVSLNRCLGDQDYRQYFLTRTCFRSNGTLIARSNLKSLKECMGYAREKQGLAFNYSPDDADYDEDKADNYAYNCQVLGCPEIADLKSLVNDSGYDYYSMYGNLSCEYLKQLLLFTNYVLEVLENATCIRSVGLFRLFDLKRNYSEAIEGCQAIGADLAMIHTELRTNQLSAIVKASIRDWYKAAFIGLDDRNQEGRYETAFGDSLADCHKFRAWAPNHPRALLKDEDCGAIDGERSWRILDCKLKMPFLCEYYATSPNVVKNTTFVDVDCDDYDDDVDQRSCEEFQYNKEEHDSGNGDRCTAHLYR